MIHSSLDEDAVATQIQFQDHPIHYIGSAFSKEAVLRECLAGTVWIISHPFHIIE